MAETTLFIRADSGGGNNPWDDTALIQAYEAAFQKVSNELGAKSKKQFGQTKTWRKGDHCRCKYSEDDAIYEAKIIKILDDNNCIVRYIGYGNEEKVSLSDLKSSRGSKIQKRQKKDASGSNAMECDDSSVTQAEGFLRGWGIPVETTLGKASVMSNTKSCVTPGAFAMSAPPPPLPATFQRDVDSDEAFNAMLLSWYMNGYHTGYYEGLKSASRK